MPSAPAVAAVPPQRPSMSTSLNITSINRDEPSASPPRHHLPKDGKTLYVNLKRILNTYVSDESNQARTTGLMQLFYDLVPVVVTKIN